MTIRQAVPADIPAINQLLQEILLVHHHARPDLFKESGQKFSTEELQELLQMPDKPIFVYEEQGEILGHLFCEIVEVKGNVLEPIKTLFIEDLCVAEAARGKKLGQKLYDFAVQYAKEIGCYNLTLDVWDDNAGARRFYERQGLKAQKTRMELLLDPTK